ncbi:hypothetical protein RHSIM_Rhsim03G0046900 [Rhododendron simsii]|uniref:PGG domain-containing protein n=1 Tax=Rhododendron simsii TaxID=118357 RepID=A0A834H7J5_RHOSS|nr:hypothetical protein RHSIM_Rhsim03G0046900 [Rhododendron simsii]
MEYRQGHYLALQKAAINGDWDKAREIIELEPDAVRTHITPTLQTALAIAISSGSAGRNRFVRELLEKMTPQDLVVVVDNYGRTALFEAVWIDNMEGAKMNKQVALRQSARLWLRTFFSVAREVCVVLIESYCAVRQRLPFMIWEVTEKLVHYCLLKKKMIFTVPHVKRIREKKERQHNALELVKFLCMEVAKLDLSKVERIFKPALRNAARVGIPEIVEEIVLSYPSALFFMDLGGLDIFKYAILYRRERVFNLIYQTDHAGKRFIFAEDFSLINGLHLVARLRHEQQINLKASAAGAVLQMQREVQWFKEVEKFTLPGAKERRNSDGMTPAEVFSDTHQDLVKEGERWMKDTATSCTIVSALIATMVFAAAITVPGGNDGKNGIPLLSKRKAFVIFGIFDAMALFSSITSVLTFLLILTSRYAEEDFLYTLPKRLITGLITLFVSILSTMVAFGAILYLVFGDNKAWILVPVVALASVPVTLFGALQFPLLVAMIKSTYGRGIFGKQSDRVLR